MQGGVVGLGCMDASISRRLMKAGQAWACFTRFRSRKPRTFAETTLAAPRSGFGGPGEPTRT